jgi:hypothetical protein
MMFAIAAATFRNAGPGGERLRDHGNREQAQQQGCKRSAHCPHLNIYLRHHKSNFAGFFVVDCPA